MTVAGLALAMPASGYTFMLDRLSIDHSGGVSFVDEFDDGAPPPSSGYLLNGTFGPEAGGRVPLGRSASG